MCHAEGMTGAPGSPPLQGRLFMLGWRGRSVGELYDFIATMMPTGQAGTLQPQQYADVLAALLEANGFPPGPDEIAPDSAALAAVVIGP